MHFCTIAARNYLAPVRLLAASLARVHPECSLHAVLIDATSSDDFSGEPFDVVSPFEIGIDRQEFLRMATIYDVMELATAIKPWVLRSLLDKGADCATYLDPDIVVLGEIAHLADLAIDRGIVLTPHMTRPMPRDRLLPDEEIVMLSGTYNLGFISVGAKATEFLDWWSERLTRWAIVEPSIGLFTDQRWIDFVPSLFDHVIVRDPEYNVAYWNIFERPIEYVDGRYTARGVPIRFFHYSGYDVATPHLLSKHQGPRPRIRLSESRALRALLQDVHEGLLAAGHLVTSRLPYGYATSSGGIELSRTLRRLYRDSLLRSEENGEAPPSHAFDPGGGFFDWLNEPVIGPLDNRVSRYLDYYYGTRFDLMTAFPDLNGDSAARFLTWAREDRNFRSRTPRPLLPPPPAEPTLATDRAPLPGFNIIGYLDAELGVGEAGRLMSAAADASGVPVATFTYRATTSRQDHGFRARGSRGCPYSINVLCVNADQTPSLAQALGSPFMQSRHNIGVWFWEVTKFPEHMRHAFDLVDEVWAPSDFIRDVLSPLTDHPIAVIPLPVTRPALATTMVREDFGLSGGYMFLFAFDHLSVMRRKNPTGLIEAYKAAFMESDGTCLVIKTVNGQQRPRDREQLLLAAAGRSDIIVLEDYVSGLEMHALIQLADCYVSLHRSEGFGLTMAQAMAWGKPTIATGYSGNLSFMSSENSFLVPYHLTEVGKDCEPYPPSALWAEPDLAAASEIMRTVFNDTEISYRRAVIGARTISSERSASRAAEFLRERFNSIVGS